MWDVNRTTLTNPALSDSTAPFKPVLSSTWFEIKSSLLVYCQSTYLRVRNQDDRLLHTRIRAVHGFLLRQETCSTKHLSARLQSATTDFAADDHWRLCATMSLSHVNRDCFDRIWPFMGCMIKSMAHCTCVPSLSMHDLMCTHSSTTHPCKATLQTSSWTPFTGLWVMQEERSKAMSPLLFPERKASEGGCCPGGFWSVGLGGHESAWDLLGEQGWMRTCTGCHLLMCLGGHQCHADPSPTNRTMF